jgi:hypothetical protein
VKRRSGPKRIIGSVIFHGIVPLKMGYRCLAGKVLPRITPFLSFIAPA